jgi:hypothetical protein
MIDIKYAKYLFKKTKYVNLVVLVFFVVLFPLLVLFSIANNARYNTNGTYLISYTDAYQLKLAFSTTILLVASYLLPLAIRANRLSKARDDVFYSLPLRQSVRFLTESLYAYLALIATWLITLLLGLGAYGIVRLPINTGFYFLYFLALLVPSFAAFAFSSLFCSLANNMFDACVFCILSAVIPLLYGSMIEEAIKPSVDCLRLFSPIMAGDNLTVYFMNKIIVYPQELLDFLASQGLTNTGSIRPYYNFSLENIIFLSSSPIYLAVMFLAHLSNKSFKVEQAEELSDKWYSYRLLLPLLFIPCFYYGRGGYSSSVYSNIISLIVISVFYFVCSFVSQRKIRFTLPMVISFAVSLTAGVLIAFFTHFNVVNI